MYIYRRFVPGFATIAKLLTQLTEEGRLYSWNECCQSAFEKLKSLLVTAPILSYPSTNGMFVLDTDASNVGIGGVLSQVQEGQERVIAYFSKVLSKPERNYCVTRRELLALVNSVEHFYKYLYGRKFLLRTDHGALKWLMQFKNPEGQVARWIERLQEYNFQIEHRAGISHKNADSLSRRPCPTDCTHCVRLETKDGFARRLTIVDNSWQPTGLRKDQEDDPDLCEIIRWKKTDRRPTWEEVAPLSPKVKSYWAQWNSLHLENGILKRTIEGPDGTLKRTQIVVPRSKIREVLRYLHDGCSGGHFGVSRTLARIRERFYWTDCKEDVRNWCRKCEVCTTGNGPRGRRKAPMRQYNVGSPFERVAIDIAGPFPETASKNKYILVAMDYFSKWVEAYPLPNQEAITVADALVKDLFSRFGAPLELHSDQGRNFESKVFQRVCQLIGIRKTRTTPLHPQSDGMVERMDRTIGKHLSKVVKEDHRNWDECLPLFLMAYRSSVHETTGQTPANILFGRELRLPCDLKFGSKPGEEHEAGDDYIVCLRKKLDHIHEIVRENTRLAKVRRWSSRRRL